MVFYDEFTKKHGALTKNYGDSSSQKKHVNILWNLEVWNKLQT
jgi:hypothetical protein